MFIYIDHVRLISASTYVCIRRYGGAQFQIIDIGTYMQASIASALHAYELSRATYVHMYRSLRSLLCDCVHRCLRAHSILPAALLSNI